MSPTTIKVENGHFKGISVNDFPCIAEQNAMQNVATKKSSFVTQFTIQCAHIIFQPKNVAFM